jgi:LysM repeat protein
LPDYSLTRAAQFCFARIRRPALNENRNEPAAAYLYSRREQINMAQLEDLKAKYASVLDLIKKRGVRLDHLHVQDGKLFLQGAAPTDAVKNQVWDQIKAVDPGYADLTADISVDGSLPAPAAEETVYTVVAGDSLWKISSKFYGGGHLFKRIIEANPDKLKDENSIIHPGDKLRIPAATT